MCCLKKNPKSHVVQKSLKTQPLHDAPNKSIERIIFLENLKKTPIVELQHFYSPEGISGSAGPVWSQSEYLTIISWALCVKSRNETTIIRSKNFIHHDIKHIWPQYLLKRVSQKLLIVVFRPFDVPLWRFELRSPPLFAKRFGYRTNSFRNLIMGVLTTQLWVRVWWYLEYWLEWNQNWSQFRLELVIQPDLQVWFLPLERSKFASAFTDEKISSILTICHHECLLANLKGMPSVQEKNDRQHNSN